MGLVSTFKINCLCKKTLENLNISGKSRIPPKLELKFNNSILLQQNPMLRKPILLNVNGPALVNNVSKLQSVFIDLSCKKCHDCMEQAIKAYQQHNRIMINRPSAEDLQNDVLSNEISYRTKRDLKPTDQTVVESKVETIDAKDEKKGSKKRTKNNNKKAVSVTKYSMDGDVYALRVQETQSSDGNNGTRPLATCKIYNVKRSYPCDSVETDALLAAARKRAYKKVAKKQEQEKVNSSTTKTTTPRVRVQTSLFRKREVDNSQVPENFMPSIEELY